MNGAESEGKTGHLRKMEGAEERLELVKADLMDLPSLQAAVEDCHGVFHTACPVLSLITHPEVTIILHLFLSLFISIYI